MFQSPDDPVALAVDLVNSWDELGDDHELMRDVATLRRFLARRGLEAYADEAGERELAQVRNLRNRLRSSFEAENEEEAVRELNEVLRDSRAVPQLEGATGAWTLRFDGRLLDVLAATTAYSLLEAIRVDGWARFGVCRGTPCRCVFVDRSRNRSRRYCSSLCADRTTQAAYRRRKHS